VVIWCNGGVSPDRCDLPAQGDGAPAGARAWVPTLVGDLLVVVVFAFLGRVSHAEGNLVVGTAATAAPFVLGLLAGWLRAPCAGMASAARARTVRFGWWLLAWTVLGGMLLRWLTGEGSAPAFVLVATGSLAVGLVARRWLVGVWSSRSATREGQRSAA